MKRYSAVLITFIILFVTVGSFVNGQSTKIKTVVIDAGHGGHDPGSLGSFSKEKDIALSIALKLGNYIQELMPGVKVIYTRKDDTFIELNERTNIANRAKADFFISIHCNANSNRDAFGTEVYTMGLSKSEANINVAKRENSVILLEENYQTNYDGFDPGSPEAYIIFSLFQNEHLEQSIDLAAKIDDQFGKRVGRHNRGVKQERFLVLWRTSMPSLLVETGFITNKAEEKYLASEQGQDYIASAIFRALKEYKAGVEKPGAN